MQSRSITFYLFILLLYNFFLNVNDDANVFCVVYYKELIIVFSVCSLRQSLTTLITFSACSSTYEEFQTNSNLLHQQNKHAVSTSYELLSLGLQTLRTNSSCQVYLFLDPLCCIS